MDGVVGVCVADSVQTRTRGFTRATPLRARLTVITGTGSKPPGAGAPVAHAPSIEWLHRRTSQTTYAPELKGGRRNFILRWSSDWSGTSFVLTSLGVSSQAALHVNQKALGWPPGHPPSGRLPVACLQRDARAHFFDLGAGDLLTYSH